jgi:hypothetical protein
MSGSTREPASLRVQRTGHASLSRAAMEYLGWPTRIMIFERYYGVDIRPARDGDHRPYRIPPSSDYLQSAGLSHTSNFNARQVFTDNGMIDPATSAKYAALFMLDDDGETPVLMVRRCDRLTVNASRRRRTSRTVPA